MAQRDTPIITVEKIRSIPPGGYIAIDGVDKKKRDCISSMLGYVKDMFLFQRGVSDYSCLCSGGTCKIYAIPRGCDKKKFIRSLREKEENRQL